jgi:hypothetical protein
MIMSGQVLADLGRDSFGETQFGVVSVEMAAFRG